MSGGDAKAVDWAALLVEAGKKIAENEAKKKAEWNALSPSEKRHRTDAAAKQVAANTESIKLDRQRQLEAKIRKAAVPYAAHDSFTALQFACLLHGLAPENYSEWTTVFDTDDMAGIKATAGILDSWVGTTLHPLGASGLPRSDWRFARAELLGAALRKEIVGARELAVVWRAPAALLGAPKPPVAAPAAPSPIGPAAPVSGELSNWQRTAVEFVSRVDALLNDQAKASGIDLIEVRGKFSKEGSFAALWREWGRRHPGADGKPSRAKDTFQKFLRPRFDWLSFESGERSGRSDDKYLAALFQQGNSG